MMTRFQFLRSLAGLGVGVVGVSVLGACSSDDEGTNPDAATNQPPADAAPGVDAPADAPAMTCAATTAAIGTNHGHTITVAPADVAAAVDKTYAIKGTSAHPHSVRITAAQFVTLRTTGSLTVSSSTDANHAHTVTVTCA
ncbi:MAG: hypothetical protein H0X17_06045 [Deltaproteobacteria bacterium]|nr:hypothetical protein [Deltaproteobacteria bacterium]